MSMNKNRITISIPEHLYEALKLRADKRGVSRFIASAVEKELLEERLEDNLAEFLSFKNDLPKVSRGRILAAIKRGRR